ncbi:Pseudouridylate synthase [Nitrosococcus oceani ATCC 19707]|uniref:tRNA pseudouridine synthase D n=2 Tax=Nitrosococcus oceani TaxID=1229 RepID=TRUD_NITOC|nr:tRNA pseudouridine(13) synthase TruD [Nitrosococcus oceani]Q3JCS7.1 RecName: Full=tRNA pseudouridine synthase D; AltName: Full=tRNA pseudouridine(13) synthase; AltName: Full=tRNA pseudouridylate synthase D; AltName: Full=tRNA-uridine isomerase D [Nitrosococcus oceani ATCC 19707]ABA57369.1 Pseudouridylate synthase [Nitrosococcus oceani ATCC 19707]KFI20346.1 pseudouridine synthase [Nitrosococcus oceani C-27]GEM20245.1 tRNA pseudouridine(13) synthase TruD [Nitrosococcus oceani]
MEADEAGQQVLAYGGDPPLATALLRCRPEDFQVVEELPFALSGEGEHVWLLLCKRNTNTVWLARQLARIAGVRLVDVGYAGLKDRHGLTTQWFSVNLSGKKEPAWATALESATVQVLKVIRHSRKLQRGALKGNRFLLTLRHFQGDREVVCDRLTQIKVAGTPNYFGPQRFGRGGQNLDQVHRWFSGGKPPRGRYLRGMLLSAARAFLFNRVLSERVQAANWWQPLPGEALILDGSHGFFVAETIDEALQARVRRFDCHPSGPLWGRGESPAKRMSRALEEEVLADYALWREGLEQAGLKQERRSLRLMVADLEWSFPPAMDSLQLHFRLPAGAYATTVLREVVRTQEAVGQPFLLDE